MNEKREVILPSDFSGEKGKIVCYRISSYLELLYIDIRSRRIPEVQIQAYEGEAVMTVNFSFLGKCEVLLKNGGGRVLQRICADSTQGHRQIYPAV